MAQTMHHVISSLLAISTVNSVLAASISTQFDLSNKGLATLNADDTDSLHKPVMEDYMERIIFADSSETQNPLINHHQYNFTINNEEICNKDVFVLILIKSSPERFLERNAIRKTWGSVTSHKGLNIVPVFIMGEYNTQDSNTLQFQLMKENEKFGDIIQGNFIEHFRNMTYKSIMGLKWVDQYCDNAKYILMTTDDTMVNSFHLTEFLLQQSSDKAQNLLYCSTFYDQGPVRKPSDKLFVTRNDYPYDKFPPHCEGFAYVMSREVTSQLLQSATSLPFFWLDDVYVTGFLPLKAGIKHTDMDTEHGYNLLQEEHLSNDIARSMFLLAKFRSMKNNWDKAWSRISDTVDK